MLISDQGDFGSGFKALSDLTALSELEGFADGIAPLGFIELSEAIIFSRLALAIARRSSRIRLRSAIVARGLLDVVCAFFMIVGSPLGAASLLSLVVPV